MDPVQASGFAGAVLRDGIAQAFGPIACLSAGLGVLVAMPYLAEHELAVGEYCALLLLALTGTLVVVQAGDLLVLFLGVELMSVPAYVLAGFRRAQRRSQEAALKYFFVGAFAASAMVFGMALIWGEVGLATGTASLAWGPIGHAVATGALGPLGWAGIALVLAGLLFKVAAAPFHMWAPDVYTGAPTPAAAYLSVGIKVAGFAALGRVIVATLGASAAAGAGPAPLAGQCLQAASLASMLVGNLVAARQSQLKRMLAYSSVAHAGYVLLALSALPERPQGHALAAAAYYLAGYATSAMGAFAALLALERRDDRRVAVHIDELAGVARRHPMLGLAMTVSLLGLAGIPPTAGFTGKVALFGAALEVGHVGLVVAAACASVVGAAVYLRVIAAMCMRDEADGLSMVRSSWLQWALAVCVAGTLGLGLMPELIYGYARASLLP
jgi:NADH-quinone oxidoreductase subunit N